MKGMRKCIIISIFMCLCSAAPVEIQEDTIVHPKVFRNGDLLEEDQGLLADIEKLRKLDALMGRVEEAAMSQISMDVDIELPLLEDELRLEDAVELVDADESLAEVAEDLRHYNKSKFSIVALPYKFKKYDLNGDGYVTPKELAFATETTLANSMEPFERADTNGDGLLTKEEFHRAPWEFAKHRSHRFTN